MSKSHFWFCAQTLVSMQNGGDVGDSAKTIRVFHLQSWSNCHRLPHNPAALVELLSQVEHWQITHTHGRTPTLVVSR